MGQILNNNSFSSGKYLPTISSANGNTVSISNEFIFSRVGNNVLLTGTFTVNTADSLNDTIFLTVPFVNQNPGFADITQAQGIYSFYRPNQSITSPVSVNLIIIQSETGTNQISLELSSNSPLTLTINIQVQYLIP